MFTHVDCFSGPGGICTGMHAAGFDTKVAIEYIQSCVDTYSANHPKVHVIRSDIREVTKEQILPFIPEGGVDLVTECPVRHSLRLEIRPDHFMMIDSSFLERGIRIAELTNAKMILFENVPAITTKTVAKDSNKLIVDVLKEELSAAGYGNYIEVVLSATDFGVPQRRKRFFILAAKDPDVTLSAPIPSSNKEVSVGEAFAGLPNVIPNSEIEGRQYTEEESDYSLLMKNSKFWKLPAKAEITYHFAYEAPGMYFEAIQATSRPGESLKDLFDRYTGEKREALQAERILPKKMFIKRNYRLVISEPSPTVTSHCLDEFVHPKYDRALTVRECARLQSFPDSYDFCGGPYLTPHLHNDIQDKYEQIGDAVPPLLAYAWGKKISSILKEMKK